MRKPAAVALFLSLCIVSVGPRVTAGEVAGAGAETHRSNTNAVLLWNANAADAALAACIAPDGNPLFESRIYATTHLAIDDALNAIHLHSRPYLQGLHAERGTSPRAAVAAAARDVLVTLIGQLPLVPSTCIDAGVASVEADYAAALGDIQDGAAKAKGIALGQAAAAAILAERATDGADTTLLVDPAYPQGTEPGEYRFTPPSTFAFAPAWGDVTPFVLRDSEQSASRTARSGHLERLHRGLPRGEASRRRRHHHAQRPHGAANRSGALLAGELAVDVEPHRENGLGATRTRDVEGRAVVRSPEHGPRGWIHRHLRHQVLLQILATDHRDPGSGHRWQSPHRG